VPSYALGPPWLRGPVSPRHTAASGGGGGGGAGAGDYYGEELGLGGEAQDFMLGRAADSHKLEAGLDEGLLSFSLPHSRLYGKSL
jgi:hypothetical protein